MDFILFEDGPSQWTARVQGQLGEEGSGETPQGAIGSLIEKLARLGKVEIVAYLYKDNTPKAWPSPQE